MSKEMRICLILILLTGIISSMVFVVDSMKTIADFQIRKFNMAKDQNTLEHICKNIYGGNDYLPRMSSKYTSTKFCQFMALVDKNDAVMAVANLRVFDEDQNIFWLEGVRVSEEQRNKGYAYELIRSMIRNNCNDDSQVILSCTTQSNIVMRHVFNKLSMCCVGEMNHMSTQIARKLPGWSTMDTKTPQRNLLSALNIEHLVSKEARNYAWNVVESEADMNLILKKIQEKGGRCGYFPGYYEVLPPKGSLIQGSLKAGRIWSSCGDGTTIFAITKTKGFTSLKSKWLLSISSTTDVGLEAAIWRACYPPKGVELMEDDVAFMFAFDGVTNNSLFCSKLRFEDNNRAVLYSFNGTEISKQ